jgi:hypothetical protein
MMARATIAGLFFVATIYALYDPEEAMARMRQAMDED